MPKISTSELTIEQQVEIGRRLAGPRALPEQRRVCRPVSG